jgi:outer membrane protein assembly factor BamB
MARYREDSMHWLRAFVLLFLCGSVASAADWPQWLGPTRDGVSTETVVPWKSAPKVLWRQPMGEGNSSPVVADGRVFLQAKVKDKDEEEVHAFDAKTGKPLWRTAYERPKFTSFYGNGPRATPAVVGGRVYTFGITGMLSCFEAATGKQVWQVDTLKQFNAGNLFFGMSCSPLVGGNRVLVNVGGKGASVVAFDKDTGEVLWKALDDKASYSSPIAFGEGKERQVVFLTQLGLVSLNPVDGSLFWRFPLKDELLESSTTPIRAGDILMATSITYGSVGLQLTTKGDKPDATEIWKNKTLTSYFSTPVPVGREHIYLVTGTPPTSVFAKAKATLHCVETKTGKELWQKPNVGKYHASLLRTGDNKLLLLEEAGNLVLLDPDLKEYRELARSKVCGETWAHPALSDGRLYLRDDKEVICLQLGE